MSRFLADENIPLPAIQALRGAGHDVFAISEEAPGASDEAVLGAARAQSRILLTFDRDMGNLIYERGLPVPPGVVLVRFVPPKLADAVAFILELVQRPDLEFHGRFTVVTRERVRQRALPEDT